MQVHRCSVGRSAATPSPPASRTSSAAAPRGLHSSRAVCSPTTAATAPLTLTLILASPDPKPSPNPNPTPTPRPNPTPNPDQAATVSHRRRWRATYYLVLTTYYLLLTTYYLPGSDSISPEEMAGYLLLTTHYLLPTRQRQYLAGGDGGARLHPSLVALTGPRLPPRHLHPARLHACGHTPPLPRARRRRPARAARHGCAAAGDARAYPYPYPYPYPYSYPYP